MKIRGSGYSQGLGKSVDWLDVHSRWKEYIVASLTPEAFMRREAVLAGKRYDDIDRIISMAGADPDSHARTLCRLGDRVLDGAIISIEQTVSKTEMFAKAAARSIDEMILSAMGIPPSMLESP